MRSVLAQSLADLEVLVVNDGSTDATRDVALALAQADPRVRLLDQPANRGVSAARNAGLDAARGEWVALLDADDAYLPQRLERLIAEGAAQAPTSSPTTSSISTGRAGETVGTGIGSPGRAPERVDIESLAGECNDRLATLRLQPPEDRGAAGEARSGSGVRYVEGLRQGEDFMFYAHALLAGLAMVLVHEPLYVYTERVGRKTRLASGLSRTIENCEEMRRQTLSLLADASCRVQSPAGRAGAKAVPGRSRGTRAGKGSIPRCATAGGRASCRPPCRTGACRRCWPRRPCGVWAPSGLIHDACGQRLVTAARQRRGQRSGLTQRETGHHGADTRSRTSHAHQRPDVHSGRRHARRR